MWQSRRNRGKAQSPKMILPKTLSGAPSIQPAVITMSQFNQPGLASAAACTQSRDKLKKKFGKNLANQNIASSTSYVRSGIFTESLWGGVMHL